MVKIINFLLLVEVIAMLETGDNPAEIGPCGELGSCQVTRDTHDFLNKNKFVIPQVSYKDHVDPKVSRRYALANLLYLKGRISRDKPKSLNVRALAGGYRKGYGYLRRKGFDTKKFSPKSRDYCERAFNLYSVLEKEMEEFKKKNKVNAK